VTELTGTGAVDCLSLSGFFRRWPTGVPPPDLDSTVNRKEWLSHSRPDSTARTSARHRPHHVYLIGFAAPGFRYSSGTRLPT
jgi:hypothetical protein